MKTRMSLSLFLLAGVVSMSSNCSKNNAGGNNNNSETVNAEYWITRSDQTATLQKQSTSFVFSTDANNNSIIEIDSTKTFQTVDGFGYSLTGGSAFLINKMDEASKNSLLNEFFGAGESSIGVSYIRISIGASDLDAAVFSYDDLAAGQTDLSLSNFSLSKDTVDLIPVLKKILAINPNLKIMGSPWSAPVWMKDNGSSIGGSLKPEYYSVYAQYFVKYIQAMAAKGINLHAITVQNEPQHGGNNPSMVMSALQQGEFVKNHLGPAFRNAGITTKIVVWDHNCNNPNYPITIMDDPAAKAFVDGSAFHLYEGEIGAMSGVHAAHPDKNLYFTEQWTGANGSFDGDLKWHIKNVIIGSMRNWSKVALEWNLASDPNYQPHTPGGCSECKGAVTISGSVASKNVSYYIVAHASKFVTPGSVRIESSTGSTVSNVVFIRPDGKKVMLVVNENGAAVNVNLKYKGKWAVVSIPGNAVATYIW
ncbi:MAG TPA: glycoside hydrolase family 30 beta sandwich domain-containing protein [Chitinophagaceae bacterium]|nr:glycoside hydrolase family 30 beta sandwich domain-containing protein [Chitinophagaceae bacterium]HPH31767.1 glycoside hydrolase family 30 beta sandwich domain-containing protein [Chitinophagaceae bacterium]HPN58456.1 glycoside hydrolase family 30 beta sandwich domain-containing protein [Chitinophagaceae bacterium]